MSDRPNTRSPQWDATSTSGAVLIPTEHIISTVVLIPTERSITTIVPTQNAVLPLQYSLRMQYYYYSTHSERSITTTVHSITTAVLISTEQRITTAVLIPTERSV